MGYTSDLPDEFFAGLRAMNTRLAPQNPHFAEWLLMVMQSESGIHANMQDHGGAPYYGLIGLGPKGFAPLDPEAFKALSETEQLPYVENYYRGAPVSKFRSPGNLYQWNFLPGSTARGFGPDTVLAAKGGTGYNGAEDNFYTSNSVLDVDGDGQITVSDLDARLAHVAQTDRAREALSRLPAPPPGTVDVMVPEVSGGIGLGEVGLAVGTVLGVKMLWDWWQSR